MELFSDQLIIWTWSQAPGLHWKIKMWVSSVYRPEGGSAGQREPDHVNGEGKWEKRESQRPNVYHIIWKRRRIFVTKAVSFLSLLLQFLIYCVSLFLEVGWAEVRMSSFYFPCIVWPLGALDVLPFLRKAGFFFLFSPFFFFQAVCAILSGRDCWQRLPKYVH